MSRLYGYVILFFMFLLTATVASPSIVAADPCSIRLGYPIIPAVYTATPVSVIVPVSASCSTSYGSQLSATATASDLNTQVTADSVNTILSSVDGGFTFAGQIGFSLPPSTQGHWLQIAVTLFDPAGHQVTTTGEAFQLNPGTLEVVTTTVTQSTPSTPAEYAPPDTYGTYQRPRFIFAYVAIAAILATVIIVTVGLLVYSRRPQPYYQYPRGY